MSPTVKKNSINNSEKKWKPKTSVSVHVLIPLLRVFQFDPNSGDLMTVCSPEKKYIINNHLKKEEIRTTTAVNLKFVILKTSTLKIIIES